jgi:hypothetical protein
LSQGSFWTLIGRLFSASDRPRGVSDQWFEMRICSFSRSDLWGHFSTFPFSCSSRRRRRSTALTTTVPRTRAPSPPHRRRVRTLVPPLSQPYLIQGHRALPYLWQTCLNTPSCAAVSPANSASTAVGFPSPLLELALILNLEPCHNR